MPGEPIPIGPFKGGLNDSSGLGEYIDDSEVAVLENLEVDYDGSLVNRPAIHTVNISSGTDNIIIGTFTPPVGNPLLAVRKGTQVTMYDAYTGAAVANSPGIDSVCSVQRGNRLYVVSRAANKGGYFGQDAQGAVSWVAIAAMPNGESAVFLNDFMIIGNGIKTTSSTAMDSRIWFSRQKDFTVWADFIDVSPGDGEKVADMLVLGADLIIFKQHSTYKLSFSTDPMHTGDLIKINANLGVPAINCAIVYDNYNIYMLHDEDVYEVFNFNFTRITDKIKMTRVTGFNQNDINKFGLTLFGDRLFLKFYDDIFVYTLKTSAWCKWITTLTFSQVWTVPGPEIGTEIAFATPAATNADGLIYTFTNNRTSGFYPEPSGEKFSCRVVTKTYSFDLTYKFKVMFWWGLSIATLGSIDAFINIPNIRTNRTWGSARSMTWGEAKALTWGTASFIVHETSVSPQLGDYYKKYVKMFQKCRFRQASYEIITYPLKNTIADSAVRIYDGHVFALPKETVVATTT